MQNYIEMLENAGLFIQIDRTNLLIDPYSCAFGTPYRQTPYRLVKEIRDGKGKFHWIDIVLITHDHPDHFDYGFACDFLYAHPETLLIAPSSVICKISEMTTTAIKNSMISLKQEVGRVQNVRVGLLHIQAMRTVHAGNTRLQESEHFSYFIEGSSTVVILGDAKPSMQNFSATKEKTDLAVAPYLYATLQNGLNIIKECFHPEQIAFYHMPDPSGKEADLYQIACRQIKAMQEEGEHTCIMEKTGQEIIFPYPFEK